MVANVWSLLGRIPWLLCLLPWAPARVSAGGYELHLTTDGPATTGVEATISASLVAKDNGSLTLHSDAHLFRFHWIHSPLMLTAKMEKGLTSTIHVVGNVPGNFLVSVWVTAADCQMCQPVAKSSVVLSVTEFLVGNLVITQNASLPSPSSYLSKTVLKASFLLHDPSSFFKTAYFLYRWDFGDGTLLVTDHSEVYYNYSTVGTSTVKVKVVVDWEQEQPGITKCGAQKTGDFSASLKLQEPLRGIQVSGPSRIQAFQKLTVTLNFLGSPPLTVCWRLKSECLPLEERECHPTAVTSPAYNLTYIFHDPGEYCLSIQAQNTVSKTHQYHRVQVWPFRAQPVVLAFPCATLITVMLAVSMYLSLRTAAQHKDLVEVADFDFFPMSAKNPEPSSGVRCCCQMCCDPFVMETPSEYLEVDRENHGLLPPLYKSAKTYTV